MRMINKFISKEAELTLSLTLTRGVGQREALRAPTFRANSSRYVRYASPLPEQLNVSTIEAQAAPSGCSAGWGRLTVNGSLAGPRSRYGAHRRGPGEREDDEGQDGHG